MEKTYGKAYVLKIPQICIKERKKKRKKEIPATQGKMFLFQ